MQRVEEYNRIEKESITSGEWSEKLTSFSRGGTLGTGHIFGRRAQRAGDYSVVDNSQDGCKAGRSEIKEELRWKMNMARCGVHWNKYCEEYNWKVLAVHW